MDFLEDKIREFDTLAKAKRPGEGMEFKRPTEGTYVMTQNVHLADGQEFTEKEMVVVPESYIDNPKRHWWCPWRPKKVTLVHWDQAKRVSK